MFYHCKGLILFLNILMVITAQELPIEDTTENNLIDTLDIIDAEDTDDLVSPLSPFQQIMPKDFLLSWHARRSLRKILAQMPCGWPEYGVPPLAPYINDDYSFKIQNSVLSTETTLKPIRVDGLNNMVINRLKIGTIFKRISFDFNFPNITLTGNFDTTTTINLQDSIGVRLFAKGFGELNLGLENLRIAGNLKYKLPIFFGSAKIHKINAQISLGNVYSELRGFINGVPIGGKVNDFIVTKTLEYLNDHDYLWNGLIEKHALPVINSQLEGQTLWKIFWWSISRNENSENTCGLVDLNNLDIEELHQLLLKGKMIVPNDEKIQN